MIDILNLAVPYFGPIFIGFACGKAKALPESGLANEFFPALRIVAGAAVHDHVENPVSGTEQPAVSDRAEP
jgi:hypothetical protein